MSDLAPELTSLDFKELLLRLSPPGKAFAPGGRYEDLLLGISTELARHGLRVRDAELEADPRTATECLPDWERMLNITEPLGSTALRQAEAYARLIARGGQSVAYFIEVAAAMGIVITITEPLSLGWTVTDAVTDPLYAFSARFIWIVDGPAATVPTLRAALVALFEEIRPTHTRVYFTWNA